MDLPHLKHDPLFTCLLFSILNLYCMTNLYQTSKCQSKNPCTQIRLQISAGRNLPNRSFYRQILASHRYLLVFIITLLAPEKGFSQNKNESSLRVSASLLSTSPTIIFSSNTGFGDNIATDGEGGSEAISDIDIQTIPITSSAGAKLTDDPLEFHNGDNGWDGYPALITVGNNRIFYGWSVKSANGANFSLASIGFLDWGDQTGKSFKIEAFEGGISRGSLTFTGNTTTVYLPLSQTSGTPALKLPGAFSNVDEVRIYQANGEDSYIALNSIKVSGPNNPPAISTVASQTTCLGTAIGTISLTVTDETVATVGLTAKSGNTTLIPDANLVFGGSGSNRTLTVTPAAGQTGTATITITAADAADIKGTQNFSVTVKSLAETDLASSVTERTLTINGPATLTNNCKLIAGIVPNAINGEPNRLNGSVTAKVWIESGVPDYSGAPYVARHYQITPVNNAQAATATITLYFTNQDFSDFNTQSAVKLPLSTDNPTNIAARKANLRIGKLSGTSSDGSGLPSTYTGAKLAINPDDANIIWNAAMQRWEVSFDVEGFSGFIALTDITPLPVKLISFEVSQQENQALLQWTTSQETNFSHFEIEKSTDARNWVKIGENVYSSTANTYRFSDAEILSYGKNTLYYRLKMMDQDGSFAYSRMESFHAANLAAILLYPNPASNTVKLEMTGISDWNDVQNVKFYNVSGQLILNIPKLTNGEIDVTNIPKGSYIVVITNKNGSIRNSKVIVAK